MPCNLPVTFFPDFGLCLCLIRSPSLYPVGLPRFTLWMRCLYASSPHLPLVGQLPSSTTFPCTPALPPYTLLPHGPCTRWFGWVPSCCTTLPLAACSLRVYLPSSYTTHVPPCITLCLQLHTYPFPYGLYLFTVCYLIWCHWLPLDLPLTL